MKRILISFVFIFFTHVLKAQTASQLLNINSVSSISDVNNISTPIQGSLIYVSGENALYYRGSSQWKKITGDDWQIIGNSSNSFFGSTNSQDIRFKTNNTERMVIKDNGNIGVNIKEPSELFEVNSRVHEVDLVPEMNSNSQNGVTLNGLTSVLGTSTTFKDAFDNNNFSNWFVSRTSSSDSNPDLWVSVDLGVSRAVTGYTLRAGSNWARTPKQYQLQGSNNGTNWTNLENINTVSTNDWQTNPLKSHSVNNTTNYRHYRLYFHSSFESYQLGANYSANYQIDEIEFKGDIPELIVNSNNSRVGINHYNPQEALHVNGNILANAFQTPDYVFEHYFDNHSQSNPNYSFSSLENIHEFIRENHHLPNLPSKKDVENNGGIIINKAVEQHLEKIEELYLHLIELEEYVSNLEKKYRKIKTHAE